MTKAKTIAEALYDNVPVLQKLVIDVQEHARELARPSDVVAGSADRVKLEIVNYLSEIIAPLLLDDKKLAEWLVENHPELLNRDYVANKAFHPAITNDLTAALRECRERKE